jgi:hypothetical protein
MPCAETSKRALLASAAGRVVDAKEVFSELKARFAAG